MAHQSRKKRPKSPRTGIYKPMARSRVTNGRDLRRRDEAIRRALNMPPQPKKREPGKPGSRQSGQNRENRRKSEKD